MLINVVLAIFYLLSIVNAGTERMKASIKQNRHELVEHHVYVIITANRDSARLDQADYQVIA